MAVGVLVHQGSAGAMNISSASPPPLFIRCESSEEQQLSQCFLNSISKHHSDRYLSGFWWCSPPLLLACRLHLQLALLRLRRYLLTSCLLVAFPRHPRLLRHPHRLLRHPHRLLLRYQPARFQQRQQPCPAQVAIRPCRGRQSRRLPQRLIMVSGLSLR